MKSILSYQIRASDFDLPKLIDFYSICSKSGQRLFLYHNESVCQIHRMTELILFVLTADQDELLLIIEGEKAPIIMGRLIECIYGSREQVSPA
ncbi:hypothetical protein PU629_16780 [Pullulanibacillus sp. KACC 23026]|uniref:hypothetical protein n=1 Tax=Pullulanibacillus sp. KACC 23026 TaxID=3028315 RepID=UPI0023AF9971|nr:hypothetical protein [Pullulanibacillus sp. KACC 23026]WEG11780.1 hypothetical protein PU629_16780 [Pullulanibacillus sp. KACC 23026]